MTTKLFRLVVCILCFFLDVHVRAAESCWGKSIPCAVNTESGRRLMTARGLRLTMGEGSLLEQREADVLQLVHGSFYIETSAAARFKTPFAEFRCASRCRALVERDDEKVVLSNLSGPWQVVRTGEASMAYALPEGMRVRVGRVHPDGVAVMEFPESLPWEPTIKTWADLFVGKSKEFKEQVEAFRPVWQKAVARASGLQTEAATRSIASHERAVTEAERRRQREEQEDAKLRQLFREKNYLSP